MQRGAPPPRAQKIETFDEKVYRKFREQPLVPIGCVATAYFLASGIKSFRDRDPIKSQRMMKYRVGAQFLTLMCFVGYVGLDNFDFRIAPMYQDVKKVERIMREKEEEASASDGRE